MSGKIPLQNSQKALRINIDINPDAATFPWSGFKKRSQESLQVRRAGSTNQETEPVATAQHRDGRFRRAEQDNLIIAGKFPRRREAPAR
jgi:hypothetical protein